MSWHRPRILMWILSSLVLLIALPLSAKEEASKQATGPAISYYRDIRPIFQANCHGCHQPANPKGGFVMTQFDRLLAGSDGEAPAIVPKQPDSSLLIEMITPVDGEAEMPAKGGPLKQAEIDMIRRWIAAGAIDDTPANAKRQYDETHPPSYDSPPIVTALDYSADGRLLAVSGYHEVLIHDVDQADPGRTADRPFCPHRICQLFAGWDNAGGDGGSARPHGRSTGLGHAILEAHALGAGDIRHGLRGQLVPR